jgi:hypothetical protein
MRFVSRIAIQLAAIFYQSIRRAMASTPRPSRPAPRCALFRSRWRDALLTFRGLINERQVSLDPRETHQLSRVAVRPKGMPRAALATERFEPPDRLRLGLGLGLGFGLGFGLGHCQHSRSFVSLSRMPPFLAAGHCTGIGCSIPAHTHARLLARPTWRCLV